MTDPRLIPEVNIGTLGHVDHGKSTLVEAISGKWPALHSEELKRGITIKLGYADATIYRCPKCKRTLSADKCLGCMEKAEPLRTISFVDAPGHETLMATVLAGASLMDGALLIIAANEKCPQPQTAEHLLALDISGIKNIIIVQNKIDLVDEAGARESYRQIKEFVKGTVAENAPIIPVSAQQKLNIDLVLEAIQEFVPTPKRDPEANPRMLVVRSFDINKPGIEPDKLKGGVLGGAILAGKLKVGEQVEIAPVKIGEKWQTITTEIVGLQKASKNLEEAGPGGLVGVMTKLDPLLTKADNVSGSVVGLPGKLPAISGSLRLKLNLFKDAEPVKQGENLMVIVGTSRTVGAVMSLKKGVAEVSLRIPVVMSQNERAAISRNVGDRWKLIGWGLTA
ncbi:MAG: translation initiation factor IF-2 subunit gamma [Candidatus Aenigmatarchaeota archaeon]